MTDIAPNYTGDILAIMNTISSCAGFITPIITAEIVDGNVRGNEKSCLLAYLNAALIGV